MTRKSRIEIDFDWKPQPEPEVLTVPLKGLSPVQIPDQMPYKGVMMIIEFDCEPARFMVIKDRDKERLRFPFGGMKVTDTTFDEGANRESLEEIGLALGLDIDRNFVGELSGGPNCTLYVFTTRVPYAKAFDIKLGEEQEAGAPFTADHIERCIEDRLFARNHANGWRMRKNWIREKGSLIYIPS